MSEVEEVEEVDEVVGARAMRRRDDEEEVGMVAEVDREVEGSAGLEAEGSAG